MVKNGKISVLKIIFFQYVLYYLRLILILEFIKQFYHMGRLSTIHFSGFRMGQKPCYSKQLKLISCFSTKIAHILQIEVISEPSNVTYFHHQFCTICYIENTMFCINFSYMPSIFHSCIFQVNENPFITKMFMNKTITQSNETTLKYRLIQQALNRYHFLLMSFPGGSVVKNLSANAGDMGSFPWQGRSPGEGSGNPCQNSCLENPIGR